jgi:hypothetical protein
LNRFKDDVKAYATQANTTKSVKISHLSDYEINLFFKGDSKAEEILNKALIEVKKLIKKLNNLKMDDTQMIQETLPMLEEAANFVALENISQGNGLKNVTTSEIEKTRFLLTRSAGQKASVWVEFLFGILVSSKGEEDLLRLNPYLSKETIAMIMNLVSICMLRANRLGHTNRCIGSVIVLEALLEKVFYFNFFC